MNFEALKKTAPVVLIPATVIALAMLFLKVQTGPTAIVISIVGLLVIMFLVYMYFNQKSKMPTGGIDDPGYLEPRAGVDTIPPLGNISEGTQEVPDFGKGKEIP